MNAADNCPNMVALSPMRKIIQQLRTGAVAGDGDEPDGPLLNAFVHRQDTAALAALVRRYSTMVWGVCCRVLRNHHDSEDAFQATFVVLVRKAASIRNPATVGNWLYGVANRTAVRVRTNNAKKARREQQVVTLPERPMPADDHSNDLRSTIDALVCRLPDKYRTVLVLCDLEGRTRVEVARQLSLPEGTVASRLTRARAMLGKRLVQKGVSAGAVAVFGPAVATAAVRSPLVGATIQMISLYSAGQAGAVPTALATLTREVLFTMTMNKIMTRALLLIALVASIAGSAYLAAAASGEPQSIGKDQVQANPSRADAPQGPAKKSNPLFDAWKGRKGKTLTFIRKTWISGGVPPGDTRLASESTVAYTVADVTPDRLTIEVVEKGKKATGKPLVVPATLAPNAKDLPILKGEEEVDIGKQKKKSKVYQYQQLEDGGYPATVNVWIADTGMVKKTVSYTVRASYLIEETLVTK